MWLPFHLHINNFILIPTYICRYYKVIIMKCFLLRNVGQADRCAYFWCVMCAQTRSAREIPPGEVLQGFCLLF